MRLIKVLGIQKVPNDPGIYVLDLMADLEDGAGPQRLDNHCYRPNDPFGLGPLIKSWLQAHPLALRDAK